MSGILYFFAGAFALCLAFGVGVVVGVGLAIESTEGHPTR